MHAKICAVVLAALSLEGALAFPSLHHRHEHKRATALPRDLSDVNWSDPANYKGVDWSKVKYGGNAAPAAPAAPKVEAENVSNKASAPAPAKPAKEAAPKKESSSGSSISGSSSSGSESESSGTDNNGCGPGFGGVSAAIGAADEYIGNVGIPFGSNIQMVDSTDGYMYTNTFINNGGSDKKMIVWLKSSPTSPQTHNTGQFGPPAKEFTLPAGGSQVVAFDKDTQPVVCDWSSGQKTSWGAFDCSYAEMDFGSNANKGWSGFDVSQIQSNGACDMSMEGGGQSSSCTANGYTTANAAVGGVGGKIPPGPLHIKTTVG